MLFGEREDEFSEEEFLGEKHRSEDMSKFETIIGARNAVTGNIEGASPILSLIHISEPTRPY